MVWYVCIVCAIVGLYGDACMQSYLIMVCWLAFYVMILYCIVLCCNVLQYSVSSGMVLHVVVCGVCILHSIVRVVLYVCTLCVYCMFVYCHVCGDVV